MNKDTIIQKTTEALSPFETGNIVNFLKHLTVSSALANPWIVGIFLITAFYAIVVRSKVVLSILFTAISLLLLIRYTMPADGETATLSTTLPFAFGGIAIGGVLIYLNLIKSE